ncbi:MAG: hypothetical protein JOZ15_07810 [Acidobacteria bacterium]|nr:hypothetical protein [Acidobacteriota bacterium]
MVLLLRELLPLLAALYLVDCLTVVRRGERLFSSCFGLDLRLRGRGLALAGVLPLDQVFAVSRLGVVATGERLYLPPREAAGAAPYREEAWTALAWEEVRGLAVSGREIRFAHGRRLRLATAAEARDVAAMAVELLALPPGERAAAAGARSAQALAAEALIARRAAFEAAVNPVAALGWALFCTIFLALPPLIYFGMPPASVIVPLLAAVAALWAGTAAASAWVARRLRREGLIGGDGALLAICLSLPSAVRASLHLGHDLLRGCDFLAAAAVLLPRQAVLPLLRAELHGAACAAASRDSAGWRRFWEERRGQLDALLRHLELSAEEVLAPPSRRGPTAAGYCPFCDSDFPPGQSLCGGCGTPLLNDSD